MTIKASGNPLAFSEIEAEFGTTPARSLGQYRSDDASFTNKSFSGSSLSNITLDAGIPASGEIKFSQFYGKKLNLVVDYYADVANLNKQAAGNNTMAATWRYQNQAERVKVVGGFRSRPIGAVSSNYVLTAGDWQGGKKIIVNVNQTVGGRKDNVRSDVALRTGNWPSGTELQIDIGPSGFLTGSGGDGGNGGSYDGGNGGNGTSALGVEYPATINNNGVIRCGYGGGGGGAGAANDPSDKSTTDFGRSGAGGGGGAGLPAGIGGAAGTNGFNGPEPINGGPGNNGTLTAGGAGGSGSSHGGATGGDGGDGGDLNDIPQTGSPGIREDDRAYTNTPGDTGGHGSDGRAIYFSSTTVQNNTTLTGNSIAGRRGGSVVEPFN